MNDEYPVREIFLNEYPETLKNMHKPPEKLFIRGAWPDQDTYKYLCVIGARKSSSYGEEACKKLIGGLRGYPICIVSGLAVGIDSFSHKVALDVGLPCVGFPGSGLDWNIIYPQSRAALAQKIVEAGGALVSPWEPTFPPDKWTFITRNRLMAGLCHSLLLTEAKESSGSLMTVQYALDFNKDVMAVPGSIFSDLSYGPHMLIASGATPVTSSKDILTAMGFAGIGSQTESIDLSLFDQTERRVLEHLRRGEISNDSLAEILKIPTHELNAKLSTLELQGMIKIDGALLRLL